MTLQERQAEMRARQGRRNGGSDNNSPIMHFTPKCPTMSQIGELFCKLERFPWRFREKVHIDQSCGCWSWQGASRRRRYKNRSYYYPSYSVDGTPSGVKYAHRFAYEFINGPIPKGLEADHICNNTLCVNPDHIQAVTHKFNCARRVKSGPYPTIGSVRERRGDYFGRYE